MWLRRFLTASGAAGACRPRRSVGQAHRRAHITHRLARHGARSFSADLDDPVHLLGVGQVALGAFTPGLLFLHDGVDHRLLAVQAANAYAHGNYWEVVNQRLSDFLHMLSFEPYVFIGALGIFLIGAAIMRSGRLLDLKANRSFFLKSLMVCALLAAGTIGIANIVHGHSMMTSQGMLEQALMTIGNLPLSLFYLCSIAYAMSFVSASKILRLLAPAGKMALTNYLMQSLIASTVFYGYGFGFWNQWGRAELALFVMAVFIAQVILSHLWLRHFRYGPMEWLWRALTYWTLPSLRVSRIS